MLKSYLAIVDCRGLRLVIEENAATQQLLLNAIERLEFKQFALVWTTMSPRHLSQIRRHLTNNNHKLALRLLEETATQIGTVGPDFLVDAA